MILKYQFNEKQNSFFNIIKEYKVTQFTSRD